MGSQLKSFVIDGSEHSVQSVISKLKFISKIKEGEKIDVSTLTLCDNTWLSSLYRTLLRRGESREATLIFIRGVLGEAFDLAYNYLCREERFYKDIGKTIIISLQESKSGLSQLANSYLDDRMFISKIEALISTLDTKIKDLERQICVKKGKTNTNKDINKDANKDTNKEN